MQKRKKWSIAPALSFFLMVALILSGQGMNTMKSVIAEHNLTGVRVVAKEVAALSPVAEDEVLDEDIQLYEGVSGYIDLDMSMPDLYFSPEEDGAYLLNLSAIMTSTPAVTTDFWFYELADGEWKEIDHVIGPGYGSDEEGNLILRRRLPNYYEGGKKYRISFNPIEYTGTGECSFYYTFEKTDLAGCDNGVVWRLDDYADYEILEKKELCIVRYLGDAQILEIPGMIQGNPVRRIDCRYALYNNTTLQIVIFPKDIEDINYIFRGNDHFMEFYFYNPKCSFGGSPWGANYTGDYMMYGYDGSTIEKYCEEQGWNFTSLGEAPVETTEPLYSSQPTERPQPTQDVSVTETPKLTESPSPTQTVSGTEILKDTEDSTDTEVPSITDMPKTSNIPTGTTMEETEDNNQIKSLRITRNAESVFLKWESEKNDEEYWIYRSVKKTGRFNRIKKVGQKNSFRDKSVMSGKTYYYKVKVVEKLEGTWLIKDVSSIKKVTIPYLKAPVVKLEKGNISGKRYIRLILKKYKGKKIEIYYRKKDKKYTKLVLQSYSIKKQKGRFDIRYLSTKEKIYFRIRTYYKSGGKKVYSKYTKEMAVRT